MSAFTVQNPYSIILALNGLGLNGGQVYIGVVNQDPVTNPQAVYWDQAFTVPANQPLQVTGGYIYHLGTPAEAFTNGAYSMKVLDAQGVQVFYDANVHMGPYGFQASMSSTGDATFAANSIIVFNSTAGIGYNLGGYSTVTGRFTVPAGGAGFYQVNAGLYLTNSGGSTQQMYASTYVNGAATGQGVDAYPEISGIPNSTGGVIQLSFGAVLRLNAGDILDLRTSPTNALRVYQPKCWFGAHSL